jgi:hypothetical protein
LGVILSNSERVAQVRSFLSAYERKDIDTISQMLASDIVLRDWNYEVSGLDAAVAEYSKNFRDADSLRIAVIQILESESGVAAELEIVVNDSEKISVVDIFTFGEDSKIASVIAYKGL